MVIFDYGCKSDNLYVFLYKGKSTGIVTTSRVTHATPAPLYAWSPDRKWEDDSHLPPSARHHGCQDIAAQIVNEPGQNINVGMFFVECGYLENKFIEAHISNKHISKKHTFL